MATTLAVLPCTALLAHFQQSTCNYYAAMPPRARRTRNGRVEKLAPATPAAGNRSRGRPRARLPQPERPPPREKAPRRSLRSTTTNPQPEQALEEAVPENADPGTAKVTRVYNAICEFTTDSLAFVQQGGLQTDEDTDTIALNLMDFMLREDNWNPALSQNKLVAACFYFASRLTRKSNAPENIAASFEWGAQSYAQALVATMTASNGGIRYAEDWTMRWRVAESVKVSSEDIELGYEILWRMKGGLRDLVGGYAGDMGDLSIPDGVKAENEQAGSQQSSIPRRNRMASGSETTRRPATKVKSPSAIRAAVAAKKAALIKKTTAPVAADADANKAPNIEKSEKALPGITEGAAWPRVSGNGKPVVEGIATPENPELVSPVELDDFEQYIADFE